MLAGIFRNRFQTGVRWMSTASRRERPKILLALPMIAFGLGTWQVYRKHWKETLIAELEAKLQADPQPLPFSAEDAKNLEYHRVSVKGTFLHDKEIIISPRTMRREMFSGMADIPTPGCHVLTPFRRSDDGSIILVNRGFVPMDKKDARTRSQGQVQGEVEIQGIIRKSEKRNSFTPDNQPNEGQWYWIDLEELSKYLNATPILIDVAPESTPASGLPVGGQTNITIRNEHMQYILTWYSLALAGLAMWYFYARPPARRLPGPPQIRR